MKNIRFRLVAAPLSLLVLVAASVAGAGGTWTALGTPAAAAPRCGAGGLFEGVKVPTTSQSPVIRTICQSGTLKASIAPFAPFGFQDKSGKFRGPGAEIIVPAMAKALHVGFQIVPVGWDTIVAGLQAGHYQIIVAGLTYTPERAKLIDYVLYHNEGTCYAVKKSSSIHTLKQLNSPSVTIGVYTGTSWATDVPKRYPKAKVDTAVEGSGGGYRLVDVLAGRITAAPIDAIASRAIAQNWQQLRIVPNVAQCNSRPDIAGQLGFGIQKDSAFQHFIAQLVAKNRAGIDKMINNYAKPKYMAVGHE